MVKELMSARLPANMTAAVRARAEAEGKTVTEVIEQALAIHLGLDYGGDRLTDLESKFADLEKRLSNLEARGHRKGRRLGASPI